MDTKNFFKLECTGCQNTQEINANPLMCRKCSSTAVNVRWNIRCQLIDEKDTIKGVINEELCERLMKMGALEGFRKLAEDKDSMRRKVE